MNRLDSIVSYFSPVAGLRRSRARQVLSDSVRASDRQMRSDRIRGAVAHLGYDAARSGRRLDSWFRPMTSANAETQLALKTVRDGARDVVRNNPLAAKGMIEFENKAVGTGIRPQARTGDERINKILDDVFEQYAKKTSYYARQRTAARCIIESGEALLRHRYRFKGEGTSVTINRRTFEIPYQFQAIEPDFLDTDRNQVLDTGYIIQGKEFDKLGRLVAYWLFGTHPGDTVNTGWFGRGWASDRVSADVVEHGYRMDRLEQVRGVSWLAPILTTLYDLDGYEDAERVRKRGESCLMAFVSVPSADEEGTITATSRKEGNKRIEEMSPGMVTYMPNDSTITLSEPKANAGHVDYTNSQQRLVAAGWGIMFELLTGNLSQVNYSSYRSGAISFKDFIEAFQYLTLIPFIGDPVYEKFFDAMKIAGAIPADTQYGVEWGPPAFDLLDRGAEADADEKMVRIGSMTWRQMVARQGYDPDKQFKEIRDFQQKCRDEEVTLDCDPGTTDRRGQVQQEPNQPTPVRIGAK
jgi:lambda family phage portal protein